MFHRRVLPSLSYNSSPALCPPQASRSHWVHPFRCLGLSHPRSAPLLPLASTLTVCSLYFPTAPALRTSEDLAEFPEGKHKPFLCYQEGSQDTMKKKWIFQKTFERNPRLSSLSHHPLHCLNCCPGHRKKAAGYQGLRSTGNAYQWLIGVKFSGISSSEALGKCLSWMTAAAAPESFYPETIAKHQAYPACGAGEVWVTRFLGLCPSLWGKAYC